MDPDDTPANFWLWVPAIVALCLVIAGAGFVYARKLGFCLPPTTNAYEAYHRQVLTKLRWNFYTLFHCNKYRHTGTARYAWAIPNKAAVNAIVESVPTMQHKRNGRRGLVVDFGAGSGFWAHVICEAIKAQRKPIDVVAIEKSLNLYVKREDGSIGVGDGERAVTRDDLWFDVLPGDLSTLVELQCTRPIDTLLLIWPPCWEDMAFDAVQAFQGNCVIYVGEPRGGCTVSYYLVARFEITIYPVLLLSCAVHFTRIFLRQANASFFDLMQPPRWKHQKTVSWLFNSYVVPKL